MKRATVHEDISLTQFLIGVAIAILIVGVYFLAATNTSLKEINERQWINQHSHDIQPWAPR